MLLAPFVFMFSPGCNPRLGRLSGAESAVSGALVVFQNFKRASQGDSVEHPFGTPSQHNLPMLGRETRGSPVFGVHFGQ